MWICLRNSFLSVVFKDCAPDELLVRSRRPGDITTVFPNAEVFVGGGTDYQYRAVVKRDEVTAAMEKAINGITYKNFKNSVSDNVLYSAYSRVWSIMHQVLSSNRR